MHPSIVYFSRSLCHLCLLLDGGETTFCASFQFLPRVARSGVDFARIPPLLPNICLCQPYQTTNWIASVAIARDATIFYSCVYGRGQLGRRKHDIEKAPYIVFPDITRATYGAPSPILRVLK